MMLERMIPSPQWGHPVVVPVLVMAGFGLLYTVIAAAKFRFEDPKFYFG